jgi:hypothetical protein
VRAPFIGLLVWACLYFVPSISHAAAIHDAAKKGDVAAISAALDAGANINESDGTATPLYYAVLVAQLEAAKLLIDRGADVNTVSALGDTPLGPAVGRRNIELIRLLLEHGANPNSAMGGAKISFISPRHRVASIASKLWSKPVRMLMHRLQTPNTGHLFTLPNFAASGRWPTI